MSWKKGADEIQALIDKDYLEQVPANPDEAAYLIAAQVIPQMPVFKPRRP